MSDIIIKTAEDIAGMRVACQLAAEALTMLDEHVQVGVTTARLNQLAHDFALANDAYPATLYYGGKPYPVKLDVNGQPSEPPKGNAFLKSICTSVNHVICHGIPSDKKKLKRGDIINIDITVIKDGYHGDTSKMYMVGEPSVMAKRLVKTTHEALFVGIDAVKPGNRFGDIGAAIEKVANRERFSVVKDFCGHGIGKAFHEPPHVMHFGTAGTGEVFEAGMIFTIEPMLNEGSYHAKVLNDGWTAVTRDKKLSAQYEHTILVTDTGYDILTLREEEKGRVGEFIW